MGCCGLNTFGKAPLFFWRSLLQIQQFCYLNTFSFRFFALQKTRKKAGVNRLWLFLILVRFFFFVSCFCMDFSFLVLALFLGFKHSFDADHLLAVANLLRKPRSLFSAVRLGSSWAIGHMLTAGIITLVLFLFRDTVLSAVLPHFETIVGFMLIGLGFWALWDVFMVHFHGHAHGGGMHAHWHMHWKTHAREERHEHTHIFRIGIVQGLASNDELLILLAGSLGVTSLAGLLLGVGVFSIGVVLGMVLFCLAFSYPLLRLHDQKAYLVLSVLVAILSIGYGIVFLVPSF